MFRGGSWKRAPVTGVMSGMKDKIISALATLFTITLLCLITTLAAWGAWAGGRAGWHTVKSSFADKPQSSARQYFHELAPALEPSAKCKDTTGGAMLCRVTIAATAQAGGRDQLIRCTGGSTASGQAGDPECHVLVDFMAKPEAPKTEAPAPAATPEAPKAETPAPAPAAVAPKKTAAKK